MNVVYATANASVSYRGAQVRIGKGSHWPADDPLVVQYPDLFSTDARYGLVYTAEPDGYDAPVETASAAPGEKRSGVRRDRA